MTFPYKMITSGIRQHPLGGKHVVLRHRKVLYEKIGPGPQKCHWCGVTIVWKGWKKDAAHEHLPIVVDHLDENKANDDPANLVPSCSGCNTCRSSSRKDAISRNIVASEIFARRNAGHPVRRLTLSCGHIVYRRCGVDRRLAMCGTCISGVHEEGPRSSDVSPKVPPPGLGGYAVDARVGPMRNVRTERKIAAPSHAGWPFAYEYVLDCGHRVQRRQPGRTKCFCPECKA